MNHRPLGGSVFLVACMGILLWKAGSNAQQAELGADLFQAIHQGKIKVVDLTHPLDDQSPYWPEGTTASPFHARVVATIEHDGYYARGLELPEHFGTHIDAPVHFDPKGASVDQIPVEKFLSVAIVVDVRAGANAKFNPDYRVTASDLENWVKVHGAMPRGCLVMIRTGWASRWPSQREYMNQDAQGVLHFPGLSLEAARYLLDHAHPVAIGIDTASIDYGPSKDFEVHHLTLGAGLYHLENLANLDLLPPTGARVIALPLKLRGGSGSPARVLALISGHRSAQH
jgi:kynurenine formamidase